MSPYIIKYHAVYRWAQRVDGHKHPSPSQMHAAAEAMAPAFEAATIRKRFINEPKRCAQRNERIAITQGGVHGLLIGGVIITVYSPTEPVDGCWCERCNALRITANRPGLPTAKRSRPGRRS